MRILEDEIRRRDVKISSFEDELRIKDGNLRDMQMKV